MQATLRMMLVGQAIGPPILAWIWTIRAEISPFLPLLACLTPIALATGLLIVWNEDD